MAELKLHELQLELAAAVASYNLKKKKKSTTLAELAPRRAEIVNLRAAVQAKLVEGADDCPNCGRRPIGIAQPAYFEIGCADDTCSERHSRGRSVEEAAAHWNDAEYFAYRTPAVVGAS
jgi:hypothetical protein